MCIALGYSVKDFDVKKQKRIIAPVYDVLNQERVFQQLAKNWNLWHSFLQKTKTRRKQNLDCFLKEKTVKHLIMSTW